MTQTSLPQNSVPAQETGPDTDVSSGISSLSNDSHWLHIMTRVVVGLVAIGAAILSFDGLTALAVASGISTSLAWIWAVVVDGFILVATLAAFAMKNRGVAKIYAWSMLAIFVIFSILGNAWHAAIVRETFVLPLWVAFIVMSIPPLALFLALHLLLLMVSPDHEEKGEAKRARLRAEKMRNLKEKETDKLEEEIFLKGIADKRRRLIGDPANKKSEQPTTATPKPIARRSRKPSPVTQKDAEKADQKIPNEATSTPPVSNADTISNIPVAPPAMLRKETVNNDNKEVTETKQENTVSDVPINSHGWLMSEEDMIEKLETMYANGEPLPSGLAISRMMNSSGRKGQSISKQFKESKGIE